MYFTTQDTHRKDQFIRRNRAELPCIDGYLWHFYVQYLATDHVQYLVTDHVQYLATDHVQYLATDHVRTAGLGWLSSSATSFVHSLIQPDD